jgi:hypothetical protein
MRHATTDESIHGAGAKVHTDQGAEQSTNKGAIQNK